MNKETVSIRIKLGYGSGDLAIQILINSVILYLLYYYTDVYHLGSASAGFIILVSRLLQALFNPVIGAVSDRTSTRWGKKRPYILFGAIPLGLSFFLVFASPDLPADLRPWYAFATSLFFFIAFSITAIPYSSLTAVLSQDTHERSVISGYRMIFAITGTLIAAGLMKPLISLFALELEGFRTTALLFGAGAAMILFITFFCTKEKHIPEYPDRKGGLFKDLTLLVHNRPFLILASSSMFFMLGTNILATTMNYYFKYNLQREDLIPAAFSTVFISAAAAMPFMLLLSKKQGKKRSFMMGMAMVALTLAASFFIGEQSLPVTMVFFIVAGAGLSSAFLLPWSMVPDTVEYQQWKTGQRNEGMLYGYFVLFFNVSAALTGLICGLGLDLAGYIPHTVQTAVTRNGIIFLMTIIPCSFICTGLIILKFYPIDEQMHGHILDRIEENNLNKLT